MITIFLGGETSTPQIPLIEPCLSMRRIVESWLNNSGRENEREQRRENRTRRKLKLCFLPELLCLLFTYIQISHFLKFIHFQWSIQNKKLTLLVIFGLLHILTLIILLTNILTNKQMLFFVCHLAVCSDKF